jgi:hypothetical protein
MIDFVSLEVTDFRPELLSENPLLSFSQRINPRTGELTANERGNQTLEAEFGNMRIRIVTNIRTNAHRIFIEGSLHKHHKGNNHEDFGISDLRESLRLFLAVVGIEPGGCIIHQIEFGVNITPPMPTQQFIDQILSLAGKEYELKEFKDLGYLKRFKRAQYEVKIYDKGWQYGLPEDILRVEIKVTRMEFLHEKGINIRTMEDLLDQTLYAQLKDLLIATLQRLIFTDDRIQPAAIVPNTDSAFFKEASNTRFWKMIRTGHRMQFKRHLERYDAIRCKYAPDDLKDIFLRTISDKWDLLSRDVTFLPMSEPGSLLRSDHHIVCRNVTPARRHCQSCGRDITEQKTGSRFCSERLYGRDAKRCRNMDSNPRNHRRRKDLRLYPGFTLFPAYLHYGT